MSNKEFFGFPSPYPNGYSEFGAQYNDVLPDEVHAYNQIVVGVGKHNLFQEIILEMVNLSKRTFNGRLKNQPKIRSLTCENKELMNIFHSRLSKPIKWNA